KQANGVAILRLDRQKGDLGVGRAGGLEQVGVAAPRGHHDWIITAEWVPAARVWLEVPAPVEEGPWNVNGTPANTGGLEGIEGAGDRVGNRSGEEPRVFREVPVGCHTVRPAGRGGRMSMGCRHEQVALR